MNIYIENIRPGMSPYNGKGKFIIRLASALKELGCNIVSDPRKSDVNFRMNALPSSNFGKVKVVRLDDVCYSNEYINKNVYKQADNQIKNAIKNADGIVYQSIVAKSMCEGVLGISAKKSTIIYNGVNPSAHVKRQIPLKGRVNFIAACQKLFPLRRMDVVLKTWDKFVADKDDAFLYIVFDKRNNFTNLDLSKYKNVVYKDIMKQDKLDEIIYSCNALINIKYQDSCPNLAIEGLAVGTPSIVSNTNGLCEIIGLPHIYTVDIDPKFTLKREEWTYPPTHNIEELIDAYNYFYYNKKEKISFPPKLHITNVAKKYISFFEELLRR